MSRRIVTRAAVLSGGQQMDGYADKVLKYIPAEVVALYVAATGMVPANTANRLNVLWIIFAFCLVATPLYLMRVTRGDTKTPLWMQVLLATIAFPVWAYALGGPFASLSWYEAYIGSLLLAAVTFLFGLINPEKAAKGAIT